MRSLGSVQEFLAYASALAQRKRRVADLIARALERDRFPGGQFAGTVRYGAARSLGLFRLSVSSSARNVAVASGSGLRVWQRTSNDDYVELDTAVGLDGPFVRRMEAGIVGRPEAVVTDQQLAVEYAFRDGKDERPWIEWYRRRGNAFHSLGFKVGMLCRPLEHW
jgi:hypothetical protein